MLCLGLKGNTICLGKNMFCFVLIENMASAYIGLKYYTYPIFIK